jgi:transcriptional regulator with XRE-family HTH domain
MGTIEQRRKRAGLAVQARIAALHVTATDIARLAGVDPKTIRGLINGTSWPRTSTQARIEEALGWDEGEIVRRATSEDRPLAAYSTGELLSELCRRIGTD